MTVEKEDKPRKIFELKFDIWDDGEVTNSIVEVVQQERGAPKKWHLDPSDFVVSIKRQISQNPEAFGDIFLELMGLKKLTYSEASDASEISDANFDEMS